MSLHPAGKKRWGSERADSSVVLGGERWRWPARQPGFDSRQEQPWCRTGYFPRGDRAGVYVCGCVCACVAR